MHKTASLAVAIAALGGIGSVAMAQPGTTPPTAIPAPSPPTTTMTPPPTAPVPPSQPVALPPTPPYYAPQAPPVVAPDPVDNSGQIAVVANFAGVGVLASAAIIDARNINNGNLGTLVVFGGIIGGAGLGLLLTEKVPTSYGQGNFTYTSTLVGALNGVLLARPLGLTGSKEWLPFVLATTALGAGGGFALAHHLDPTSGQSTFIGTTSLLGVGTAGLILAATADDDVDIGDGALTTIALGLDAGALGGAIIAPRINWSRKRSYYVAGGAMVGMMLGSMVGALVAGQADGSANQSGDDVDPDGIAMSMLLGLWGGFGAGVLLTGEMEPDPAFARRAAARAAAPSVSLGPTVLPAGGFGLGAAGQF